MLLAKPPRPSVSIVILVFSLLSGAIAFYIANAYSLEQWREFMSSTMHSTQFGSYEEPAQFGNMAIIARAQDLASISFYLISFKLLLLALILLLMIKSPKLGYLLIVAAMLELFTFALKYTQDFDIRILASPDLEYLKDNDRGDYRVFNLIRPNRSMTSGTLDISGYNSKIESGRYREFFEHFFPQENWRVEKDSTVSDRSRIASMLRLKYVITPVGNNLQIFPLARKPMPRALLIGSYVVAKGKDRVFSALAEPSFDPERTVVLESEPAVKPQGGDSEGTVSISEESTGRIVLDVSLPSAKILLFTDSYSRHWKARGLAGSVQDRYEVLPANYVLRAIPLTAGRHRIVMEYSPLSFLFGALISGIAAVVFMIWGSFCLYRRRPS